MPLEHSASKEAFSHNVSEMMHSGHPQKQAVAAAYHEQRSAQHDDAPFGGVNPMGNPNNEVETSHDGKGYMAVAGGDYGDMIEKAKQLWEGCVNDPENANGIVTSEHLNPAERSKPEGSDGY